MTVLGSSTGSTGHFDFSPSFPSDPPRRALLSPGLSPLAAHGELTVHEPMEEQMHGADPIDAPRPNARQQGMQHAVGKRVVANEPQEVTPIQSTGGDQMRDAKLRKNAEAVTKRGRDPRKEIVAARE